jgi:hypothetical protein
VRNAAIWDARYASRACATPALWKLRYIHDTRPATTVIGDVSGPRSNSFRCEESFHIIAVCSRVGPGA